MHPSRPKQGLLGIRCLWWRSWSSASDTDRLARRLRLVHAAVRSGRRRLLTSGLGYSDKDGTSTRLYDSHKSRWPVALHNLEGHTGTMDQR